MNTKKYQLENYRKYLLNRVTATPHLIEYIENCLANGDEAANHSFHKIIIHNWTGCEAHLFDALTDYFGPVFVPVNYTSQGAITSFYTSSLSLVLKITKMDFMFPHQRNMYNIDILFNDKTSADCFENRVTIDDIVAGVVSRRLDEKLELDLTDFCNDPEFLQMKIHLYKISLLSNFKILMLRMGRDARSLNLSNNNLSTVPVEILNFFIKGDLLSINLSNNNIPSLQELRASSKIEKLWLEGNPLCEDLDPVSYVKKVTMKFPRLNELDGVRLNDHGVPLPFNKNYLVTPDRRTKMLVDKFLSLYFSHYDHSRKKICSFYADCAVLTMSNNFTNTDDKSLQVYANQSRNIFDPTKRFFVVHKKKIYQGNKSIHGVFGVLPRTLHDPTTFTVDVLSHTKKNLVLVVDGVFKERNPTNDGFGNIFHFRRTFVFNIVNRHGSQNNEYYIIHEMFNISLATEEMIEVSFKDPTRGTNALALLNPDAEDVNAMSYVFSHLTQLRKTEAEQRLKQTNFDITKAIKQFARDLKENKIPQDRFIEEEDDFSDTSSLMDEID